MTNKNDSNPRNVIIDGLAYPIEIQGDYCIVWSDNEEDSFMLGRFLIKDNRIVDVINDREVTIGQLSDVK